jgi:hypothetical protein
MNRSQAQGEASTKSTKGSNLLRWIIKFLVDGTVVGWLNVSMHGASINSPMQSLFVRHLDQFSDWSPQPKLVAGINNDIHVRLAM